MPYIIGTAGHIDHGKTRLVKVLTGQNTDRLKEEKERGISIDLGFAHLTLPDGTQAGVVDVPGHERFVRNMLAGAHGIDLVLMVIAADDGVMPQTEEHFDIVRLLGVKHGLFVITKADLASPERLREVEEEITLLAMDSPFADAPMLAFSALTLQGLPELHAAIAAGLARCVKPPPAGYFRMPVDRAFLLQGHGLVVTGTAQSGSVSAGEQVRCLPGGERFRVRSVQVHGEAADQAGWGQRVALNLAGSETAAVRRGQVICHEKIARTSQRFDAIVELPRAGARGVRNHQRVRIHIGTAEVPGKLVFALGRDKLDSRESAYCQVLLDEPALVMRGDHFIIRDEVARRTLGGGQVIHPWAVKHRLKAEGLAEKIEILKNGDFAALAVLLASDHESPAVPLDTICQFFNLTDTDAAAQITKVAVLQRLKIEGEQLYVSRERWQGLAGTAQKLVSAFHQAQPLAAGMDLEDLRARLPSELPVPVYRALVDGMVAARQMVREGSLLRLQAHRVTIGGAERVLMDKIRSLLSATEMAPPDLATVEKETRAARPKLMEALKLLEREGVIIRVGTDLYFVVSAVASVKETMRTYLLEHETISAAAFRDLIGSTRKYIIPFLEYFDRSGFTVRVGDNRKLKAPMKSHAAP